MANVQRTPRLKVQTSCIVPADWILEDGSKSAEPLARPPRVFTRKITTTAGKKEDAKFVQVGPGAILDASKIPAKRKRKMLDKDFPAAIPMEEPIPPSPKKTAVHQAAADAGEEIARVDTGKARKGRAATKKKRT